MHLNMGVGWGIYGTLAPRSPTPSRPPGKAELRLGAVWGRQLTSHRPVSSTVNTHYCLLFLYTFHISWVDIFGSLFLIFYFREG